MRVTTVPLKVGKGQRLLKDECTRVLTNITPPHWVMGPYRQHWTTTKSVLTTQQTAPHPSSNSPSHQYNAFSNLFHVLLLLLFLLFCSHSYYIFIHVLCSVFTLMFFNFSYNIIKIHSRPSPRPKIINLITTNLKKQQNLPSQHGR